MRSIGPSRPSRGARVPTAASTTPTRARGSSSTSGSTPRSGSADLQILDWRGKSIKTLRSKGMAVGRRDLRRPRLAGGRRQDRDRLRRPPFRHLREVGLSPHPARLPLGRHGGVGEVPGGRARPPRTHRALRALGGSDDQRDQRLGGLGPLRVGGDGAGRAGWLVKGMSGGCPSPAPGWSANSRVYDENQTTISRRWQVSHVFGRGQAWGTVSVVRDRAGRSSRSLRRDGVPEGTSSTLDGLGVPVG